LETPWEQFPAHRVDTVDAKEIPLTEGVKDDKK